MVCCMEDIPAEGEEMMDPLLLLLLLLLLAVTNPLQGVDELGLAQWSRTCCLPAMCSDYNFLKRNPALTWG